MRTNNLQAQLSRLKKKILHPSKSVKYLKIKTEQMLSLIKMAVLSASDKLFNKIFYRK